MMLEGFVGVIIVDFGVVFGFGFVGVVVVVLYCVDGVG